MELINTWTACLPNWLHNGKAVRAGQHLALAVQSWAVLLRTSISLPPYLMHDAGAGDRVLGTFEPSSTEPSQSDLFRSSMKFFMAGDSTLPFL